MGGVIHLVWRINEAVTRVVIRIIHTQVELITLAKSDLAQKAANGQTNQRTWKVMAIVMAPLVACWRDQMLAHYFGLCYALLIDQLHDVLIRCQLRNE